MKHEKLLCDLIGISSESGNEKQIGEYICEQVEKIGLKVKRQPVDKKTGNFNIYAWTGRPRVIFSNHIDTVPVQIRIRRDGDRIYGRGACDNKSQVAAAIQAASQAMESGLNDFGLLFTVQEETDFRGALKSVDLIPSCELIVIGEPTGLDIVRGHNGIVVLELIAHGKSAHGSTPENGLNAIEMLMDDLNVLRKADFGTDRILGKNILNIGRIAGGIADNIVPDEARASIAYRTVIASSVLIEKVKSLVKSEIGIQLNFDPVFNDSARDIAKIVGTETKVVRYFTEASVLGEKGPVIIMGAGDIKEAHGLDESVSMNEYSKLIGMYFDIIKYFNA